MSDTTLDLLREQLRDLELDAVLVRGRIEQLRDTIALLENGPSRRRLGRPPRSVPSPAAIQRAAEQVNGPQGVAGGAAGPWAGSGHVLNDPDPEAA